MYVFMEKFSYLPNMLWVLIRSTSVRCSEVLLMSTHKVFLKVIKKNLNILVEKISILSRAVCKAYTLFT